MLFCVEFPTILSEAVMRHLFVFCALLMSTIVSAEPIVLSYTSPWAATSLNTWRTTFMRHSDNKAETIELTLSDEGLTFLSRATCDKKGHYEVLTWKFKDRYATGTGCSGEEMRVNTVTWRNRVVPLPPEVAARYRD